MKARNFTFLFSIFVCVAAFSQHDFYAKLAEKAIDQTKIEVVYDASYYTIPYPNGDVPAGKGVCTDVVIRSYRALNIDLQRLVHEDMVKHWMKYPHYWKLKCPDSNIDHRRVPNLMAFFTRRGSSVPVTDRPGDYKPGDIVCWNLQNKNSDEGITHIGIVSNVLSADGQRYKIVHNIGAGNKLEDMLFDYTIIGHFRYAK